MRSPAIHRQVRHLAGRGWPDRDIAEWLGVPRTTVRDIRTRRPRADVCPRCWRPAVNPLAWSPRTYVELLGFYLGDGCIGQVGRTQSLRLSLDPRYPGIVERARSLLAATFLHNPVTTVAADAGRTLVLCVYSNHMACLFPQHGAG